MFDGKTYDTQQVSPETQAASLPALAPLLIKVQNDATFRDKKWFATPGASIVPSSPPAPHMPAAGAGDNWNVAIANTGAVSGLTTAVKVLDSGKRQISISLGEFLHPLPRRLYPAL